MKVYQYPNCSTCKKALRFLKDNEVDFESPDITLKPPSKKELKKMAEFVGLKKLFNTSGQVYREMKLKDKIDGMSESEAISLLAENGKLIKRPFLLTEDAGLVGFKENDWKEALELH